MLAALFAILPTDQLLRAFRRVSPLLWAAMLVGFLAGHAVGAIKWRTLLGASGLAVDLAPALRAYAVGLFANLWLPSIVGGDLVRAGLLAKDRGGGGALAVGGVADRLLDAVALALLAAAGLLLAPPIPGSLAARVLALAAIVIAGVVALALALRALRRSGRRLPSVVERALVALDTLLQHPAPAATALVLSLVVQSAFVVLNARLGAAMGIEAGLAVWLLAWPLAKLVASLPIALGGIGVREAALAGLLAPFGVPAALAVAQSLVWQTILVAGGLVAASATAVATRVEEARSA